MGWLIALGILILLLILPLGVSLRYDSDGFLIRVIAGFVRLKIYPGKKKSGKTKEEKPAPKKEKKKKKKTKSQPTQDPTHEEPKKGGSFLDFLPLVKVALNFLGDFRRKLRVNRLDMNLILAGGDPCDLATNYGKACSALGGIWPLLEEWFVIKKRDVRIQCDFEGDETLIIFRLDLTITLGRIIALVVRYGIRAIKELIKINNKRKGGAAL